MSRGPQGQKRPADVIGNAVTVACIATGEIEETGYEQPAKVKGGLAGAVARKRMLSPERRQEIASLVAAARWSS